MGRWGMVEVMWIKAFKDLKKFSGGWSPSENSVCPCPLLQFLQLLQFMSVRLGQFTLEGCDVELDNCLSFHSKLVNTEKFYCRFE